MFNAYLLAYSTKRRNICPEEIAKKCSEVSKDDMPVKVDNLLLKVKMIFLLSLYSCENVITDDSSSSICKSHQHYLLQSDLKLQSGLKFSS